MTSPSKILIVEDEAHIAEGIAFNLKKLGHEVDIASNGILALEKWESFRPDLIVLDIMLPKIDGHEVLKIIRKQNDKIPILILSAKGQPVDRIRGLSIGGDDYLSKPFELEEFILRIQRLLERANWNKEKSEKKMHDLNHGFTSYEFGKNKIDFLNNVAVTSHGEVQLTEQEIKLLKIFITNNEKALSRKDLLEFGWGYNDKTSTRTLDNFIVRFRKYFEEDSKNPRHFKSLRGKGYMFNPEGKD